MFATVLTFIRKSSSESHVGNYFPQASPEAEAMRWRGIEVHVGRERTSLLISGGPSVMMNPQDHRQEAAESLHQSGPYCLSFNLAHVLQFDYVVTNLTRVQIQRALSLHRQSLLPVTDAAVFLGWYARIAASNRGEERVTEVILRQDMISAALGRLGLAARDCELVFVRADEGQSLPVYWSMDGQQFAARRRRNAQWQFNLVWLWAFAMLTVLVWANYAAARAQLLDAEGRIAQLATEAGEIAAQQAEELDRAARSRSLTEEVKRNRRVSAVIEKLSEVLDDDVVLSSLTLVRDGIVLEGSALAPEPLIAALGATALFAEISFASPIVRPAGETRSRFSISSRLQLDQVR